MLKYVKNITIFVCVFSVTCIICSVKANDGDAGQPGEFLRYGVGARALGMGRAFTAVANDASAIYWNPGGLMGLERSEFTSMYADLFYDSRFTYVAVAFPRLLEERDNQFLNFL